MSWKCGIIKLHRKIQKKEAGAVKRDVKVIKGDTTVAAKHLPKSLNLKYRRKHILIIESL